MFGTIGHIKHTLKDLAPVVVEAIKSLDSQYMDVISQVQSKYENQFLITKQLYDKEIHNLENELQLQYKLTRTMKI